MSAAGHGRREIRRAINSVSDNGPRRRLGPRALAARPSPAPRGPAVQGVGQALRAVRRRGRRLRVLGTRKVRYPTRVHRHDARPARGGRRRDPPAAFGAAGRGLRDAFDSAAGRGDRSGLRRCHAGRVGRGQGRHNGVPRRRPGVGFPIGVAKVESLLRRSARGAGGGRFGAGAAGRPPGFSRGDAFRAKLQRGVRSVCGPSAARDGTAARQQREVKRLHRDKAALWCRRLACTCSRDACTTTDSQGGGTVGRGAMAQRRPARWRFV